VFFLGIFSIQCKIRRDRPNDTRPGAQPALHFGGAYSWTFIRWRHRAYSSVVQLFRRRSQI